MRESYLNKSVYNSEVKKKCNRFKHTLTKFDIMAEPFDFYLPDGNTQFKTVCGGVTFICFAILFLTFFITKMANFVLRSQYTILETTLEKHIGIDQQFGKQNNFVIAAALNGRINSYEGDIKDIAELKFYLKGHDNINEVTFKELKSRPCT